MREAFIWNYLVNLYSSNSNNFTGHLCWVGKFYTLQKNWWQGGAKVPFWHTYNLDQLLVFLWNVNYFNICNPVPCKLLADMLYQKSAKNGSFYPWIKLRNVKILFSKWLLCCRSSARLLGQNETPTVASIRKFSLKVVKTGIKCHSEKLSAYSNRGWEQKKLNCSLISSNWYQSHYSEYNITYGLWIICL